MPGMKHSLLAISLCLAAGTAAAGGIYQCREGEVTVFQDQPCGENTEPYAPEAAFSVVTADVPIDAIAERNREYIEARREQRREAAERARQRAERERRLNANRPNFEKQDSPRRTTSEATPRTAGHEATPPSAGHTATPPGADDATSRTSDDRRR